MAQNKGPAEHEPPRGTRDPVATLSIDPEEPRVVLDELGEQAFVALGPDGYPQDMTNAQRLVACWNACLDVSTEWLETQKRIVLLGPPIADRFSELERELAEARHALEAILADPYGCRFCDSGKLRNADKGHDPECGYALAQRATAVSVGQDAGSVPTTE